MELHDLTRKVAKLFLEESITQTQNNIFSERLISAQVGEKLQKENIVVVNEFPYNHGSLKDSIADMRIRYGENNGCCLWIEVKPMFHGSNYWNYSKFFYSTRGASPSSESSSIILNDIDKMNNVPNPDNRSNQAFGFLLVMEKPDGFERTFNFKDKTKIGALKPMSKVKGEQVLLMSNERFDIRMKEWGGQEDLILEIGKKLISCLWVVEWCV
jgi:hypothetical protein